MSTRSEALIPHRQLPMIHLQHQSVLIFSYYELQPWLPPCQSIPFGPGRLRGASHHHWPDVVHTIWLHIQAHGMERDTQWSMAIGLQSTIAQSILTKNN